MSAGLDAEMCACVESRGFKAWFEKKSRTGDSMNASSGAHFSCAWWLYDSLPFAQQRHAGQTIDVKEQGVKIFISSVTTIQIHVCDMIVNLRIEDTPKSSLSTTALTT